MEVIKNILEAIIHLDKHLDIIIKSCGSWSYLLLFLIIFAETGLVVTPFLPGDSLIFAVGTFTALGTFNLWWLFVILVSAAIIGDTVNYSLGKLFGDRIIRSRHFRFIKKEHIERTHKFYEKYGGKTIVLARFIPIIRTFAPFVAGIGKMSYLKFVIYNILGGFLWVSLFLFVGYFFGNIPVVKNNFLIVILVIMLISALPIAIEFIRSFRANGINKKHRDV